MGSFLAGVVDGVTDDAADVFVGETIGHLATTAGGRDKPGATQHPQVLGHQGLACPNGGDQLVHAPGPATEFKNDGQAHGRGQRSQQHRRWFEPGARPRLD
jgi:hypothetical protein